FSYSFYSLMLFFLPFPFFFSFNDTATTEIYTLSLHDALPISGGVPGAALAGLHRPRPAQDDRRRADPRGHPPLRARAGRQGLLRSEEHTSELQSLRHLVCRLLLEKKKKKKKKT